MARPQGREDSSDYSDTDSFDANFGHTSSIQSERAPLISGNTRNDPEAQSRFYDSVSGDMIRSTEQTPRTLTMFTGVLVPVTLSMFSSLMYLRMGFVVGQAGVLETLLHFVMAYGLLTLTTLSISAISTNGAIEGGGAYFMISRALGPEFGGAMGLLFYLAQVFSCALYIAGFVEGFTDTFDDLPNTGHWWPYLYASGVCFICLIVCLIGGQMFARTSLIILLVVIICTGSVFVSFFAKEHPLRVDIPRTNELAYRNVSDNFTVRALYTGFKLETLKDNLNHDYRKDYATEKKMNFATVFAILFSSVTGIMNGANMSGELKNPSKAIPRGTFTAMLFTFIIYVLLALGTAATCERKLLRNYYNYLQPINLWPPFVNIGVFATTLSAALGNMIGASRILEAVAKDGIFWRVLDPVRWTTKGGNPIVAVLVSFALVEAVLLIGSLNAIAPMTTVIFLLSYSGVNLACMALDVASAPNFRPTFRYFSWHTTLLGMLGCLAMTFLINPIYASGGLALLLLLVILLHFRSLPSQWGSISQAIIFHQVRKYLLLLDPRKEHVKYWRPQMLLLVANPRSAWQRISFVNDLKKSGLFIIGHVKTGDFHEDQTDPVAREVPAWMELVDSMKVKAFIEITMAQTVNQGAQHLARISGLGGMKPNTVCVGFYDNSAPEDTLNHSRRRRARSFFANDSTGGQDEPRVFGLFDRLRSAEEDRSLTLHDYVQTLNDMLSMQKNICLLRHFEKFNRDVITKSKTPRHIDVWPINVFNPGSLNHYDTCALFLLQLATVLHMVRDWHKRSRLRVFLCTEADQVDQAPRWRRKLETLLSRLRINARVEPVPWDHVTERLHTSATPGASEKHPTNEDEDEEEEEDDFEVFRPMPEAYLSEMNNLVQQHSKDSAAVFMYLPQPPARPERYARYVEQLEVLTEGLCPTVLVHGLNTVTSTAL